MKYQAAGFNRLDSTTEVISPTTLSLCQRALAHLLLRQEKAVVKIEKSKG
jgi:hypothetical protein